MSSYITKNWFTAQDSITFINEILTLDNDLDMASLDVGSLFTNMLMTEINCTNKLFQNRENLVNGISKNYFRGVLNLATRESFLTFNNNLSSQLDGVAMGSPLARSIIGRHFCHSMK